MYVLSLSIGYISAIQFLNNTHDYAHDMVLHAATLLCNRKEIKRSCHRARGQTVFDVIHLGSVIGYLPFGTQFRWVEIRFGHM